MERNVRDEDNIEWACVQAYSGVARTAGAEAAAEASGLTRSEAGTVPVVCTPSRAEQTMRLELPDGWAEALSDEELLQALAKARRRA